MGGRKRTWEAISFEVVMTAIALIALIVIIAPSLVVLIVSFTNGFSLKFPPPGYSARWYAELWNAWQLHFAAKNSFVVAMWSTGLSIVLGVAAALAIARSPNAYRHACWTRCSCRRWCFRRSPSDCRR